jgi:hypothetical protein
MAGSSNSAPGQQKSESNRSERPERRSQPRVPRHNIRRAKLLVIMATLTAILGGWLAFASAQAPGVPLPIAPAPIGAVAPPASTLVQPFHTQR